MLQVKDALTAARIRLLTIGVDRRLTEAASLLADGGRRMVVVCNNAGAMVGVLTRGDIVRQIGDCTGCACMAECAYVMSADVISCRAEQWLRDVWLMMNERGLVDVPIINNEGEPIGLLTARDALELLLSETLYEEKIVIDYITRVGYH
ncbi:CBS domain-containing protein [Rhodoblastus sp.]|jgi:CBS domain-containing protein|uniref:CBS domain-containing protein n=1 Tax=Rhodoblastus sp. TaxID=1962975 RepID=UPI0025F75ED1|nr:CBS domain-containing protein [Rhodoblastus sp.]